MIPNPYNYNHWHINSPRKDFETSTWCIPNSSKFYTNLGIKWEYSINSGTNEEIYPKEKRLKKMV